MKKRKTIVLFILVLAFSMVFTIPASAKSVSKKLRNKICKKYSDIVYDYYCEYDYFETILYDINKDGIPELIMPFQDDYAFGITGQACVVYTWKNNKAVKASKFMKGLSSGKFNQSIYSSGKYFVTYCRQDFFENDYYVYKMSGGKFRQIARYRIKYKEGGGQVYYKNNKRISKNTFKKFEKTLKRIKSNSTWENNLWDRFADGWA